MQKSVYRIQLSILLTLVFLCCTVMTSCGTYLPDYVSFWREISPQGTVTGNDDGSITYNGRKYVSIENYNGKITPHYDSEDCVKIATMPYSYLLGAVSVFYADDAEDPDLISCSRGDNVWVKEGIDIDELIMNNPCVVSDTFSFRICDVITDEVIPYTYDMPGYQRASAKFYGIPLEDYPAFTFCITVVQLDGELYLQYVWNSDFYRITDEFEAELYANGLLES